MTTTFVLKTAAQIGKMVDTAIAHTAKGDMIIHEAAVQCLAHAEKHGDTTLLDRLVKGLGRSIRVEGLRVGVAKYSPVRWNGDGKVGALKAGAKGYVPYDVAGFEANPFWTLGEADERTAKPLNIDAVLKVIHGLKGRVEKAVKEGKFEGDHVAALNLVENVDTFTTGYLANHPVRDGAFDPNDPDNAAPVLVEKPKRARKAKDTAEAPTDTGVAPPAATPRRARRKATTEQIAA